MLLQKLEVIFQLQTFELTNEHPEVATEVLASADRSHRVLVAPACYSPIVFPDVTASACYSPIVVPDIVASVYHSPRVVAGFVAQVVVSDVLYGLSFQMHPSLMSIDSPTH